jgi:hypothetical protein
MKEKSGAIESFTAKDRQRERERERETERDQDTLDFS